MHRPNKCVSESTLPDTCQVLPSAQVISGRLPCSVQTITRTGIVSKAGRALLADAEYTPLLPPSEKFAVACLRATEAGQAAKAWRNEEQTLRQGRVP